MTDADLAASSHPLWPRWKGLVRFLRSSRGALPSAQPAARLLRTSHRLTRTLTDEADVQLDVSGSRFLLTRRIPDVELNRFQWLIYVGDCSTSPGTVDRDPAGHLLRLWTAEPLVPAKSSGKKRRWPWQRRDDAPDWRYVFALDPAGRFVYGLAVSDCTSCRVDWASIETLNSNGMREEAVAASIKSRWLRLGPGEDLPESSTHGDRLVHWCIQSATQHARGNGEPARQVVSSAAPIGCKDEEAGTPRETAAFHVYTAAGWHACWTLDRVSGTPSSRPVLVESLDARICYGWQQQQSESRCLESWLLAYRERDASPKEWLLFSGSPLCQRAVWSDPSGFLAEEIDFAVVFAHGAFLLCGSHTRKRVALFDLRPGGSHPLRWTRASMEQEQEQQVAALVLWAVPWGSDSVLVAISHENGDRSDPSVVGRLECWRWDLLDPGSTSEPERLFVIDWTSLVRDTDADVGSAPPPSEYGCAASTLAPNVQAGADSNATASATTTTAALEAQTPARRYRWTWLGWRVPRKQALRQPAEALDPAAPTLVQMCAVGAAQALALLVDQHHGYVVYLEQPDRASALAEVLLEHDSDTCTALMQAMHIPAPMEALLRWRCSPRDADAARALVAALPTEWRWAAAYEAIQNRAATLSAARVLLRAVNAAQVPRMVAEVAGLSATLVSERAFLISALSADALSAEHCRVALLLHQRAGWDVVLEYLGACSATAALRVLLLDEQEVSQQQQQQQQQQQPSILDRVWKATPLTADPQQCTALIEAKFQQDRDPLKTVDYFREHAGRLDDATGSLRLVHRLLAAVMTVLDASQASLEPASSVASARSSATEFLQQTLRLREALQWEQLQPQVENLSLLEFARMDALQVLERLLKASLQAMQTGRALQEASMLREVLESDLVMHMLEGVRALDAHQFLESALEAAFMNDARPLDTRFGAVQIEGWCNVLCELLEASRSCKLCRKLDWRDAYFQNWCWSWLARALLIRVALTRSQVARLAAALRAHDEAEPMLESIALSEMLSSDTPDPYERLQLRQWLWQARQEQLQRPSSRLVAGEWRKRLISGYATSAGMQASDSLDRLEALLEIHGLQLDCRERLSGLLAAYRRNTALVTHLVACIEQCGASEVTDAASLLWQVALFCFKEESYPVSCTEQLLQYGAKTWRSGSPALQARIRALLQTARMVLALQELGLPTLHPRRLAWEARPAAWLWHFSELIQRSETRAGEPELQQVAALGHLDTATAWLLARRTPDTPSVLDSMMYYPPDAVAWLRSNCPEAALHSSLQRGYSNDDMDASRYRLSRLWGTLARRLLDEAEPFRPQVQQLIFDQLTAKGALPLDLAWIQRYYGGEPSVDHAVQVACTAPVSTIAAEAWRYRLTVPAILYRYPLEQLDPTSWLDTSIALWILRQPADTPVGRAPFLPPAGDVRLHTCGMLQHWASEPAMPTAAQALVLKFQRAAEAFCEAFRWVSQVKQHPALEQDTDLCERYVRRFLEDASYRETVVVAALAHTTDEGRLAVLIQPKIDAAARLGVSSAQCRLEHVRWCFEQAQRAGGGAAAGAAGATAAAAGVVDVVEATAPRSPIRGSMLSSVESPARWHQEHALVTLLVQHDGLGQALLALTNEHLEAMAQKAPHPLVYLVLASTERHPRAVALSEALREHVVDMALDWASLWLLFTANADAYGPLATYLCERSATDPEAGLQLWRLVAICVSTPAPLLAAAVEGFLSRASSAEQVYRWLLETTRHDDDAVRHELLGVWAAALVQCGGRSVGTAAAERSCIFELIDGFPLDTMRGGEELQCESQFLVFFVRRVLEYMEALWNDRVLASARVSAMLCERYASACSAAFQASLGSGELSPAVLNTQDSSLGARAERSADRLVVEQTLAWLRTLSTAELQQWQPRLHAIFAIADATVSLTVPEAAVPARDEAQRRVEQEESNADASPVLTSDSASNESTEDSIVAGILRGNIWQAGSTLLQRRRWSLVYGNTPEAALVLLQRHLEEALATSSSGVEASRFASRSEVLRALAVVSEWRTALGLPDT